MNDTIKQLAAFLEKQSIDYRCPDDNEEVIWFSLKLPSHDAAATFFVNYSEATALLVIIASRMVKFSGVGQDLFVRMNDFNADPTVFGCKMFIDPTGELTVSYTTFIRSEPTAPQIVDLIDIVLSSADRYYPAIVSLISGDASEPEE